MWENEDNKVQNSLRPQFRYRIIDIDTIPSWPQYFSEKKMQSKFMFTTFKCDLELNEKISLFEGNIVQLNCECIVNSADEGLSGGGALDHKIHMLGGPLLDEECMLHDGCPFGQAVITRGYLLPQKYVIHSPAPYTNDPHLIASCYQSSLALAAEHKIRTLAFPCIGAGAKCFPLDAHAQIALQTVRRWLETDDNQSKIDKIIFCFWRPEEKLYYTKWMPSVFPLPSTLAYGEEGNETQSLAFWAKNMINVKPWIYGEEVESDEEDSFEEYCKTRGQTRAKREAKARLKAKMGESEEEISIEAPEDSAEVDIEVDADVEMATPLIEKKTKRIDQDDVVIANKPMKAVGTAAADIKETGQDEEEDELDVCLLPKFLN